MNKKQIEILSEGSLLDEFKSIMKSGSELAKDIPGSRSKIRSITSAATNDLVAQFPVLISNGISIDTASVVSSAVEKDMAVTMLLLVSANKVINYADYDNPIDWLKRFHTNIGFEFGEDSRVLQQTSIELLYEGTAMFPDYKPLLSRCKVLTEGINLNSKTGNWEMINENEVKKEIDFTDSKQAQDEADDDYQVTCEVLDDLVNNVAKAENDGSSMNAVLDELRNQFKKSNAQDFSLNERILYGVMTQGEKIMKSNKENASKNSKDLGVLIKNAQSSAKEIQTLKKSMIAKDIKQKEFDSRSLGKAILKPTEVKKANEMTPTVVNVQLHFASSDKGSFGFDFDFGVKSILHVIKSDIFTKDIIKAVTKGGSIFNFIRWTSGEIKFVRDFLFDIDNVKSDALQELSATSDHILAFVKKRKRIKKFKRLFSAVTNSHDILPNSTFVLTSDEVTYIKDMTKIDLMNTNAVNRLMKEYFLLQFIIVDETGFEPIVYVFKDGDINYQTYTLRQLEANAQSNNNRLMQNMSSMLNKSL